MINLAWRDSVHNWGKLLVTGCGLGLLVGVTVSMAGVYRGMVEDAEALIERSGADLWVVEQYTLGPFAEASRIDDDLDRSIRLLPGVRRQHPPAALLGHTDSRLEFCFAPPDDRHVPTVGLEMQRRRAPDAGAATGNDRDLVRCHGSDAL